MGAAGTVEAVLITAEAIFITAEGSAPMQRVDEVRAVRGGLEGDRYLLRTGYWTSVDECQVTMIEGEALDEIEAAGSVSVSDGEHRRNIVTRGVTLRELAGARLRGWEAMRRRARASSGGPPGDQMARPRSPLKFGNASTSARAVSTAAMLGGDRAPRRSPAPAAGTVWT